MARGAGSSRSRLSVPTSPWSRTGARLSTWDDDPWAGAAYSISSTPEQATALAEPVGPIEFAGEHTGGPFSGLMEGAIRSGRRAAAAIGAAPPR